MEPVAYVSAYPADTGDNMENEEMSSESNEPLTEDLLERISLARELEAVIEGDSFVKRSFAEVLQEFATEKGLSQAEIARRSGLSYNHVYYLFRGDRGVSRNKALALAFALGLTVRETGRLLQAAGVNGLYAKDRRDAILIFCLDHGYTFSQTEEELFRFGEPTLGESS